jgi:4-hydroxy-tetrahydrodipicolinate reductase
MPPSVVPDTIRVGVIGYRGRMGSETCRAVEADSGLELAATIGRDDDLSGLSSAAVDAAVDFTTATAVMDNVRFLLEVGIHAVVGTTGLDEDRLDRIHAWASDSDANVIVAPNFALGAALMMTFARKAAPFFSSAEIVERHHENKADAPSGTAMRTASLMNEERSGGWFEPRGSESLPGSRGGDVGGIRIHSLRVAGSVAHQEVIFGGAGETLTIRHDSLDRSSFMPGVVLALKRVSSIDGVVVGLENLLDL